MAPKFLFLPAAAMAALTSLVWIRLYVVRIGQMRRERIHPQAVATSAQASAKLTQSAAADNFRNLFELPVLFYAGVLLAAHLDVADGVTLALAWAFVALRAVHSAVQCTVNHVMSRFVAYVLATLVLFALWVRLACALWSA
jgi:hypothetical protein